MLQQQTDEIWNVQCIACSSFLGLCNQQKQGCADLTDVMCLSRICSVSLAPKLPLTAFLYINTVDFNLEFSVTMCYSAKSFVSWCLENSIFMVNRVYPAQSATAFYESISLIFGKIANVDIVFLCRALDLYYN